MVHPLRPYLKFCRLSGGVLLTCLVLMLQTGCAMIAARGEAIPKPVEPLAETETRTQAVSDDVQIPATSDLAANAPEPVVQEKLDLKICKMKVSNRPDNVDGVVSRESATGCVNGVSLLVAPAPLACLTSGYGMRGERPHKALDFQSRPAGNVVAAGDGEVIFRGERKRFGNWVLIDHGADIYTAYAHLALFDPKIKKGVKVSQGQVLGVMGDTGQYTFAIHLHYEIRQGKLNRKDDVASHYFKLEQLNPFELPASCPTS